MAPMLSFCRFLLLMLICFSVPSAPLKADDATVLKDRLHTAATESALDSPGLRPWHLLLSFQLLDPRGQPSESGTIEEWWAAPNQHKTLYTTPSYTNMELTSEGELYKSAPALYPPEALLLALDQIVHPLPSPSEVDDSKPELRKQDFGKVPLDCIMLDQKIGNLLYPPLGLFPTYCFDRDKTTLRLSSINGSVLITRNRIGLFQGKSVVIDQSISIENLPVLKAHLEKLSSATFTDADFTPTAEMVKIDEHPVAVAGGVVAGSVLKKVPPIYPEKAKANHVSGKVVLRAIIGTDGRIHHLTIVSTPDPDLAVAAYAAVRHWLYKPYLLNGQPTEVDTTITVNFAFGPG